MTSPSNAAARRRELLRRLRADAGLEANRQEDAIPVRDRAARAPLSSVQHSLWTHHRMYPGSTSYNGCLAVAISGPLDTDALRQALHGLVVRHEILRTTYRVDAGGEPHQVVSPADVTTPLPVHDLGHVAADDREAEAERHAVRLASRPFDLSRDHPIRFELLRFAPEEHALVQVVHHIAWDGGTWGVLSRDLAELYGRFAVAPSSAGDAPGGTARAADLRIQYADFAAWEHARPVPEAGLAFWRERLTPPPAPTALPADGPRPALAEERGGRRVRSFAPELADSLRDFAAREGVTAFTAALTAFAVVLHRYTGDVDIPVGTLVMDRSHPDVAPLVGNFGNTVVLRADLSGKDAPLTFRQATARMRDVCADAFAHQDTPFDAVLDALRPPRRPGRTPLFDTMFGLLTQELGELDLPGLRTTWRHIHNGTTQFDLALEGFLRPGSLVVEATYREGLFAAETIDRMLGHLETVLAAAVANPDTPVGRLGMLPPEELAELTAANSEAEAESTAPSLAPSPVAALIDRRIRQAPDRVAVVADGTTWTYAELDARADEIAAAVLAHLRATGAEPGTGAEPVVALAVPRCADLVAALVGVLRAGAAYLPLDLNHPRERVAAMLADARPDLLLGTDDDRVPDSGVPVLRLDAVGADAKPLDDRPAISPDSPAYVVFTSGSTGRPKAVAGTQRALANRLRWGRDSADIGSQTPRVRVAKSALTFIDGTTELLGGLVNGDTVVIADDTTATDPLALTALIDRHAIEVVTAVPSLLATLLDTAAPGSLASVKTWIVSGEALPAALADTVAARTPDARLVNLYGCSEAAGDSLAHTVTPADASEAVPIGRPIAHTRAYLLDAHLAPVPPGVIGELYVSGDGLARGYLDQPAATAERFVANPFGPPGSRLYRTGDLARRRNDGTLAFHGRADHQVKIRGIRIEPAEIELLLLARPEVARAVVVAVPPEPILCAYVVAAPGATADPAELRAALAQKLPAQLVPGAFVVLDELPLNPNGKVDRAALPAPGARTSSAERRAPADARERALHAVFAEFLRLPPEELGVDDDFFALGGHSLLAARVANRIRGELRVEVSVADVFNAPTVAALARLAADAPPVRPRVRDFAHAAPTADATDSLGATQPVEAPASFAQAGLWFDEQVRGSSAAYCLPLGVRLRGAVDPEALRAALRDVVARHEALRTVLCAGSDDLPLQRVLPVADSAARLRFDVVEAGTWPAERLDAEISALVARPFRLDTDIPVRAGLFLRQEPDGTPASVLVLVLHHAAADRWSFTPLLADLARAYESRRGARPLPVGDVPPVRYTAYSAWQRALLGERGRPTALAEQQLTYWEETLRGAPAETPLPADRPRPATPSHRGGNVLHTLSPALTDAVRRIAHDTGASVFMVLHAGVAALLHRHGSGNDIVLGAPVSGRTDEDLDDVVGFFVNSVVLRTDTGGDPTFADLVARVRTADLAAFAHADIPFERVVDRLHPERSAARHPVFQVMIAHHRAEEIDFSLSGTDTEAFLPTSTAAMFDLDLRFVETGNDGIAVHAGYATDLFDHDTVTRLLARLTHLLDAVTNDPSLRVSEAPVLPTAESEALLRDSVGATRPVPAATVVDRIAEQATRTPAATALVDATSAAATTISYAELDARANRLARLLIAEGAAPGGIVAVALPRSPALVVALLAVLKSGAAYLPIELDHPDHRVAGTIADAAPSFTVTSSAHAARIPGRLVVCDSPENTERLGDLADSPVDDAHRATPLLAAHPAYVMYTSGSTGRPKGVVVPHQALANQLAWVQDEYGLTGHDRMLHKSPIGFDVSIWELFWPLSAGAAVVLAAPDGHRDPAYLATALVEHRVSAVHFVPPVLDAVLTAIETDDRPGAARPTGLRLLLCGGEALPPRTATRSERVLGLTPHNTYGPTEATITATAWAPGTGKAADAVPIGRPVWNTGALVLDERLRLAPVGRTGELYLTGAGLADGYLNRRGLTAERFTANPFGAPGERMYRTGDLVRRRADGALVFVGRTDSQVKLRGVRIELGEIEAELASRQDVRAAVVLSRPGPTGAQRLIAYVVPAPGTSPDAETVRGETAERLPEHMVPAAVVVLDALPTTATGKTDFAALPDPERTELEAAVPPSGPVEEALARLFADVLKVDGVGAKESFFTLGGDSIGATLLAARARKAGLRFTVRDVFRHPSVAALARVVVTDPKPETAASTPVRPSAEPGRDAALDAAPTTTAEPRVVPAPPLLHVLRDQAGGAGPRGCHVAVLLGLPTGSAGRWDRLVPAITELVRRHDALRLTVTPVSRRLWRTTATPAGASDTHADVTLAEPVDPNALPDLVRREVRRAADQLDLTAARTLRVVGIPGTAGAADHLLVIAHPLALDEASVERIAHELAAAMDESGAAIGSHEMPPDARPTATPDAREATGTGAGTGAGTAVGAASGTSDVAWWVEALRGAVAVEPPAAEQSAAAASDTAAAVPGHGLEAVVLLSGTAADARNIAVTAFLTAVRGWLPTDAERLVVDRMVDPRRDVDLESPEPVGSFTYVYPLAFAAAGPLPDVADLDVRGAAYTSLRYANRGGARELARTAVPRVLLRDARAAGAVDLAPAWGAAPRWTLDAALACGADGDKVACRLSLTPHLPVPGDRLRDLLDLWVAAVSSDGVARGSADPTPGAGPLARRNSSHSPESPDSPHSPNSPISMTDTDPGRTT